MPAPSMQPVNFFAGANPDLYQQQLALQHQQALAQKLMEQGSEIPSPNQPTNPGGFVPRFGPLTAATGAGKMMAGAMMQRNINKQQGELAGQQMQAMIQMLRGGATTPQQPQAPQAPTGVSDASAASSGSPWAAASGLPQPAPQPQMPSQAGGIDPSQLMQLYAANAMFGPAAGQFAAEQMKQTDLGKNIAAASQPGLSPLAQAAYSHTLNPPINVRPGGTVFVPGQGPQYTAPQGGVQMAHGPQGPQASLVPGFVQTQTELSSVPKPSAPMVKLPMSGGQTIELTQPEYLQWQQTKQLPERFGGKPSAPSGGPALGGLGVPGATQSQQDIIRQEGQRAANVEASKEFISEMRQNYAKLRDVPATLANMERAKALAAGQAGQFMGPFGESKLATTKFFRANVPGMGNLDTSGVTNAEQLQSTLFNQVMDNLKKMDASPSQYQQQVMQEAFGTLRTDPMSVPKIMDVFSDILRNRVDIHNQTVRSAEQRGTAFPHDINVALPQRASPGAKLNQTEQQELDALRKRFGR